MQSDVPGTPIQKWTPRDQISTCYNGTAHAWPSYNGTLDDASLYDTMFAPPPPSPIYLFPGPAFSFLSLFRSFSLSLFLLSLSLSLEHTLAFFSPQ